MIENESEIDPLRRLSLQDFSYSRLSCFSDCQLKYFYSYIIRVPQDFGHPAKLGNIVHEALELTLEDENKINKFELLTNYQSARQHYDPNEEIPEDMIAEGERQLIEFADRLNQQTVKIPVDHPDYAFEREKPFSFVNGRARLNGFIDYVSVREKEVKLVDYKTGKNEVSANAVKTNLQLGIYSLYMKHLYPDKDPNAELYYLKTDRKKGHVFTEEDLELIQDKLDESIETVLNTEDFKATKDEWKCKFCSYARDGTCGTGEFRLKKKGILSWD